jgi:hypothetical protein
MMRSILQEGTTLELQHINVKLPLQNSLDLEPVIPIFHEWIQNQAFSELLLDVADYRHVKEGPGVLLIGHEADYSLDQTDGRLGVRYNRKARFPGTNQDRLEQAIRSALNALQKLQSDSRLQEEISFDGRSIEILINDRLLVPNNSETRNAASRDFETLAARLFEPDPFTIIYSTDLRRLFGVRIESPNAHTAEELLHNLHLA